MKVAFLGRGETGLGILRAILKEGFDVAPVWTCQHTPEVGASAEAFEELARKNHLPYRYVENINRKDKVEELASFKADIAVAIFWTDLIEEPALRSVKHGFLNLHGGALPRYRGNACANWAILKGETKMGITIHLMEPGAVDSGPILAQEMVPITKDTIVEQLIQATREVGVRLIIRLLKAYRSGKPVPSKPQDEKVGLRCYPRIPEYGQIDWRQSAAQIDRHIRSLGPPYPRAFTYFGLKRIEILEAEALNPSPAFLAEPGHIIKIVKNGEVWVATGQGVLILKKIWLEGDTEASAPGAKFFSIRQRFGTDVVSVLRDLDRRLNSIEKFLRNNPKTG